MSRSIGERNIRRRGQANRAGGLPGGSPATRAALRSRRLALALTATCAMLLALAVAAPAHSAHAATLHDSGALRIVVPSGNNGSPAGPVGTYVTVQASSLTPNGDYKLGVALQDAGCQGGFTDLGQTTTADSTGSIVTTFQWPESAKATGSSYVVCAQSQADNSFETSDSAFTVLSDKSPSIGIKRVAPPAGTSTPTASTPQPLPNGVFQAGDYVQITGRDFLPGGTGLAVYLSTQQIKTAQDVQSLTPLPTADGSSVSSNASGSFVAIVQIPAQTQSPSQYYLYVTSTDGDSTTKAPPSLEAYKQILVEPAPAPTATPTNTPTPTVTATPATGGSSTGGTGGGKPTGAIIALGVASILLFILGVILLASAATTPRQAQR